ncbi:hypothetical protein Bbelb_083570 [Branchiostoma belcheri]|nr:hypothetical protein Bbelb_083570 [Branchiostoma belcheri]
MEISGWIYVVVIILGIIIAATLIGCLLTILVIWTRPVLQKLVNAPLVSLSCADIISCSFGVPLLIHAFLHPGWEPPGALCWLQAYATVVLWGVSSCHMACIAVQRYFMVCTSSTLLKSKRVLFSMLSLTWLIPFLSALPIHIVEEVKVNPKLKRCGMGASTNQWGKMLPTVVSFMAPFIVTIISYHVRMSKKRVGAHANPANPKPLSASLNRTRDGAGPLVGTASARIMTNSPRNMEDSISMGDQSSVFGDEDKKCSDLDEPKGIRSLTDQAGTSEHNQGENPPSCDEEERREGGACNKPVSSTKDGPSVSGTAEGQNRVGQGNSPQNSAAERQITRMMMILFAVYTVCSMPLIVMVIFSSRVPPEAFTVGQVLMALNGALNPIIYGLMNRNIRQGYRHIRDRMLNSIV